MILCTVPPSLQHRECHWPHQVVPPSTTPSFSRRLHPPVPPASLHGACLSSVADPPNPPLLACCLGEWLWCHCALTPPHCGYDCCKVKFSEFTKKYFSLKCLALHIDTTTSWNHLLQIYKIPFSNSADPSVLGVIYPDELMSVNDPTGWGVGASLSLRIVPVSLYPGLTRAA